jgi:GH3 auxin-responsive promoter
MFDNRELNQVVSGSSRHFLELLDSPRSVQVQVLQKILKQNQSCTYGLAHHFSKIESPIDYAREVPISTYELLASWVTRIADGETDVLTTQSVIAFEKTGGSSIGRKLIPYTESALEAFQLGLLPWLDDLFTHHPSIAKGRFYWAISPACRPSESTSGGVSIGMPGDAAYFGEKVGRAVANALAVSAQVSQITDFEQWRNATLLELLSCEDLTLISVWSPTFLTELLKHARENRNELAKKLKHRAVLIEKALGKSVPDYQAIWPNLRVISCWDQASAKEQANLLRQQFPNVLVQGKGLLATEGLVTIPLHEYEYPVLALESGFFEFIDSEGTVLLADQLQVDSHYQLIVTNASGLYRYAIGDEVRVRGFAKKTPMLEFMGRSNTSSDLCGEKLSDSFVTKSLSGLGLSFAMLAPARPSGNGTLGYALLIDHLGKTNEEANQLADRLERNLLDNPQYAYARRLGQLKAVEAVLCKSPLADWLKHRLAQGQKLGDIKVPALLTIADWQSWVRVVKK